MTIKEELVKLGTEAAELRQKILEALERMDQFEAQLAQNRLKSSKLPYQDMIKHLSKPKPE